MAPSRRPQKVGKQSHLDFLIKNSGVSMSYKSVALFDDDKNNIMIAGKKGLQAWFCDASKAKEEGINSGFTRDIWVQFIAAKGLKGGGGCVVM